MKSKDAVIFAVGSLSMAVSQWLMVWLFARFAGAAAVGAYSLTLAVATPVFVVGHFGLRTVYLTFKSLYPWASYLLLRLAGIALANLVLIVYFHLSSSSNLWLSVSVLFVKSMDACLDLLHGRLQRENLLKEVGALSLLNSAATVLVVAPVILATESIPLAIAGSGLVSAGNAILSNRLYSTTSSGTGSAHSNERGYRQIIRAGFPTTLAEGIAAVSTYLPLLFLSMIADAAVAGVYATAAYLLTLAGMVGAILKNVLTTSFRLTFEESGSVDLFRKSHRIVGKLLCIGVLMMPIIIIFGSPVLEFVYGASFTLSYGQLSLLALAALGSTPAYIYSTSLNVLNRYDGQAWTWLGACLLGLLVGIIMISVIDAPPIYTALMVAAATTWGRFAGVLALTMAVQRRLS